MAAKDRIRPSELFDLLERQKYRCAYTGEELTPDNVSADHVVPVAQGGGHSITNIRLVIRKVNQMKGTLSFDEFVSICRKVVEQFDRSLGESGGSFELADSSLFDGVTNGEE